MSVYFVFRFKMDCVQQRYENAICGDLLNFKDIEHRLFRHLFAFIVDISLHFFSHY